MISVVELVFYYISIYSDISPDCLKWDKLPLFSLKILRDGKNFLNATVVLSLMIGVEPYVIEVKEKGENRL